MVTGTLVSVLLVGITMVIHYGFLQFVPRFAENRELRPRHRVFAMLFCAFAAHTLEIYIYAIAYLVLANLDPGNGLSGQFDGGISDYLYFSASSYTSLGYGDVLPQGAARLVAGTEALNGLILIAWTASATYLLMGRYWHPSRGDEND